MPWEPLPTGQGANPMLKRFKAMDVDIYGNIFAHSGEIDGDFDVTGNLLVGGGIYLEAGGIFATGLSGDTRVEITATAAANSSTTIDHYLYDGSSIIRVLEDWTRMITTDWYERRWSFEPDVNSLNWMALTLYGDTGDLWLQMADENDNATMVADYFKGRGGGTASDPDFGFTSDGGLGMYASAADQLGLAAGSSVRVSIDATRVDCSGSSLLTMPVKTTTGDPASPTNGDMYVNTSDNKIRVYADAAWRDLATW